MSFGYVMAVLLSIPDWKCGLKARNKKTDARGETDVGYGTMSK